MNKMKNAKKGELRIIGGKWKGKKIYFDLSKELRPTPDRAKEVLFNWLGQDLSGASCLDLFSGTGALCLLYTSPSPRDGLLSRMPSSA